MSSPSTVKNSAGTPTTAVSPIWIAWSQVFRVEQLGGTAVLFLNSAHRFYTQLYAGADSTAAVRAALEVLLFSIGDCINEAPDQTRAMYDLEVPEWSKKLDYALMQLARRVSHDDGEVGDAEVETAEAA